MERAMTKRNNARRNNNAKGSVREVEKMNKDEDKYKKTD